MDPGRAPERTALAWQRTALAILFASLLLARLTVGQLGFVAIAALGISLPLTLWVYAESRRRYRGDVIEVSSGGRTTLAIAFAAVLGGLCELAALLGG
jgi:uncharacterized membrane protein YidH (DUF202 family)